jgi:ParE toxin of type II toxin-antitoxin system, parDE
MTYRFLSPALSELSSAVDYYELQKVGLGSDLLDQVDSTIARILQFPNAWGKLSDRYRHCNLRRFPYTIVYTVINEQITSILSSFLNCSRSDSNTRPTD